MVCSLMRKTLGARRGFKTPLTIIKGNADLLKETQLAHVQNAYCEDISKGSDEIARYIETLLLMAKDGVRASESSPERGETTRVGDLVEGFHRDAEALVNIKGLELDWNEETDCFQDLFVKGKEEDLKRALVNVLPMQSIIAAIGSAYFFECPTVIQGRTHVCS